MLLLRSESSDEPVHGGRVIAGLEQGGELVGLETGQEGGHFVEEGGQDVLRQFVYLFLVVLVIYLEDAVGRMALLVLLSHPAE